MWTPTHVVVTVTKARNLLDKGKGGNDAYCMIGMGKEKFLTSVKTRTLCPVWEEQAEFALGEREDLKITVYHKSSIIDEFVGRVIIDVADLASQDNNHSYMNWYKLGGKPEKSGKSRKPEKERGELEIRVDFVIKPKAGSMMDLSLKNKEKSLSLRNLKDKMTIKGTIGEKLSFKKSGQPKYSGENQCVARQMTLKRSLAEQAKRMGGSKLDFLDGDDIGSITSSYSSINGPTLMRGGQMNSMGRLSSNRQFSSTSKGTENDSASINDNSRNDDEDFDSYFTKANNNDDQSDADSLAGSSFQRRNSSRYGSSLSRKLSTRKRPVITVNKVDTPNFIEEANTEVVDKKEENNDSNNNSESIDKNGELYIAPLLVFNGTSTPQLGQRGNEPTNDNIANHKKISKGLEKKTRNKTSSSVVDTIEEENVLTVNKSPEKLANQDADSFASIFTTSLTNSANNSPNHRGSKETNMSETRSTITDSFEKSSSGLADTSSSSSVSQRSKHGKTKAPAPVVQLLQPKEEVKKTASNPFLDDIESPVILENSTTKNPFLESTQNPFGDEDEDSFKMKSNKKQAPVLPSVTSAKNINNFPMVENDDDDNIEWDSSEDEEIVKKEVASFERHQLMRQSERRRLAPVVDLTSDLNSEADFNMSSSHRNNHGNNQMSKQNKNGNMQLNLKANSGTDSDIKTPDFDEAFQDHFNTEQRSKMHDVSGSADRGLPDLINQKGGKDVSTDKARKYLEGLDGVKFNEVQVPDTLKKQLEYFDRDELLQLIAYQKKYLDFKETRIKDLENYIDNLVVKIIETEPLILMNANTVLSKSKNII